MDSFEMNFDNIVKHEPGHEMSLKSFLGYVKTQYLYFYPWLYRVIADNFIMVCLCSSNCKNNMAIYQALDLEHLTLFSFKFSDLERKVQDIMSVSIIYNWLIHCAK